MKLAATAGLVLILSTLTAASALADKPPSAAAKPPAKPDCVEVRSEASFASVGYDHLVHLTNHCKKPVSCQVKTDVNPEAQSVDAGPSETKTVVTWRGSPARVFTPDVTCRER